MTSPPVLVLLHGAGDTAEVWTPHRALLAGAYEVLAPSVSGLLPSDPEPFSLTSAADAVAGVVESTGRSAALVCGVGLGAMVAMTLAAEHPQRVAGLALITRQVRPNPLVLSLPAVVLGLLPAVTVQRLGLGRDPVVALLDQVRRVDFAGLAARVPASTVVLWGAGDALNGRASRALVHALPDARLERVPRARPGWWGDRPELLTGALGRCFPAAG